ncbi:CLUMA_CG005400, isoform A [Clunio marinus]|uniref:CLUMA_CG005400, isoform A n=1 Tax=Clunio marinus TaxID=568069 RepID=A0A1J1HUL9_9DIPT|nr:CLUMA_CG005400, isoform A [Clunio marinus]
MNFKIKGSKSINLLNCRKEHISCAKKVVIVTSSDVSVVPSGVRPIKLFFKHILTFFLQICKWKCKKQANL